MRLAPLSFRYGAKTITDLYRCHDVVRFLDEDAGKLVGFQVGIAWAGAHANPYDPGGDRTRGLRIKSPLLYQLSYRVVAPALELTSPEARVGASGIRRQCAVGEPLLHRSRGIPPPMML